MMIRRTFTILIVLSALVIPMRGFAQDTLVISKIEGGFLHEIVAEAVLTEAYQQLGITLTTEEKPAERALVDANEGVVDGDLIRKTGIEEQYPNLIMVPVSVTSVEWMAFTKQVQFAVQGWESLKPYLIAFELGLKVMEENTAGMNRIMRTSTEQVFQLLDRERVEVAVAVREDGLVAMKRLGLSGITMLEPPLERTPLYHYLHKKHAQLVPKLTEVLQKMGQDGRIKAIQDQVLGDILK